jgi:hypothetical protein
MVMVEGVLGGWLVAIEAKGDSSSMERNLSTRNQRPRKAIDQREREALQTMIWSSKDMIQFDSRYLLYCFVWVTETHESSKLLNSNSIQWHSHTFTSYEWYKKLSSTAFVCLNKQHLLLSGFKLLK